MSDPNALVLSETWQDNKTWSDKFIPAICNIIGPRLLIPAPFERDTQQATDLIILKARDMTIACRVRRYGYSGFYNQFTVRSNRPSGVKTEFDKFADGWGDWMFYGHSDKTESGFAAWHLLDLASWRCHLIHTASRNTIMPHRCGKTTNTDGTAFIWFDIYSFVGNPPLVIDSFIPSR